MNVTTTTASTITISLGVYATLVVIWYFLKGDVDARWKVGLLVLSAASLPWLTMAALRVWGVAGSAIDTLMHVQQANGAGVLAPWL